MDIAIIDEWPHKIISENDVSVFIKGPDGVMMGIEREHAEILRGMLKFTLNYTIDTGIVLIMGTKQIGG